MALGRSTEIQRLPGELTCNPGCSRGLLDLECSVRFQGILWCVPVGVCGSRCVQVGPSVISLCVCVGAHVSKWVHALSCVVMCGHVWLCLLDLGFELCSCLTLGKCWQLMN